MRPRSRLSPLSHRLSAALVAALVGLGLAVLASHPGPAGAAATGTIEVRILAQGDPIPGVPVQVRPTGEPGLDTWMESPSARVDTSDARGIVRFADLAPGRYHVIGHCGRLPGDCIAGNIATKAEVIPGATAHATLTLRRGGRILGRAVVGERALAGVTLQTESADALPSSCPILEPRNPGPDGNFTVGKVPVGNYVWVKALRPLGRGDLQVWKDFHMAKPETVSGSWSFPDLDSASLGTVRIGVRLDDGHPAGKGRIELSHLDQKASWRYTIGFDFTEAESLTILPSMPPGEYSLRAMATPGVKAWWNATAETLLVAPGVRRDKIIQARLRQ